MSGMGLMPGLSLLRVRTDSSVAKSFVATRGLGKMRRLQEAVPSGRLVVGKVKGTANIARCLDQMPPCGKVGGAVQSARCCASGPDGGSRRAGGGVEKWRHDNAPSWGVKHARRLDSVDCVPYHWKERLLA